MPTKFKALLKTSSAMLLLGAMVTVSAQTVEPVASNPAATQKFTLDIAKAKLAADGTTEGDLDTATSDVQAMRDAGMGWGAIANFLGLRLGDVVSGANKQRHAESTVTEPEAAISAKGSDNRGGHGGGRGGGNGGGNGGGGGGGKR
jgi:uncharacterized membrane protein YgcG